MWNTDIPPRCPVRRESSGGRQRVVRLIMCTSTYSCVSLKFPYSKLILLKILLSNYFIIVAFLEPAAVEARLAASGADVEHLNASTLIFSIRIIWRLRSSYNLAAVWRQLRVRGKKTPAASPSSGREFADNSVRHSALRRRRMLGVYSCRECQRGGTESFRYEYIYHVGSCKIEERRGRHTEGQVGGGGDARSFPTLESSARPNPNIAQTLRLPDLHSRAITLVLPTASTSGQAGSHYAKP